MRPRKQSQRKLESNRKENMLAPVLSLMQARLTTAIDTADFGIRNGMPSVSHIATFCQVKFGGAQEISQLLPNRGPNLIATINSR
jgi:hypothetical protein